MLRRLLVLCGLLALVGCGSDSPADAGGRLDAGGRDAGRVGMDGGRTGPVDSGAGSEDGGAPGDSGPREPDAGRVTEEDGGPTPDGGSSTCWEAEITTIGAAVYSGTTAGATAMIDSFECDGLGPDTQLLFTAPSDGSYAFVVTSDEFDPAISLHRANCASLKELACADDTGDEQDATASAYLAAGDRIVVNVDGLGAEDSGAYALNVSRIDDTCPNQDLGSTVGVGRLTGVTLDVAAGDNRHAPCTFGGGGRDLSYRFTAPTAGDYDFVVVNATFDSVIYAIEDACDGETVLCNDDSFVETEDSAVRVTLDVSESVIVVVEGFSAPDLGTFDLNVAGPF